MTTKIEEILRDAQSSLQKRDHANAVISFQQALELDPDSTSALFGLGSCLMQQAQFGDALGLFEKASKLEPEAVDIAYNHARCLAENGDRYAALVELQRATQYCRDDPVFCPAIADLLVKLGEWKGAIELLARLSQLTPADQIILARAKRLSGDLQEAVRVLFRLSEEIPNDATAANELATTAANLRDYPIAIMAFERYLKAVTPTANDYLRFADLLLLSKQPERSEQAIKLATERGEDGAELYALKAKIARLKGDYVAATEACREAIDRSARHGQAWLAMAELMPAEQLEPLLRELQSVVSQAPSSGQVNRHFEALLMYALANMHERLEQYQAAANALSDANKIQAAQFKTHRGEYSAEHSEQLVNQLIDNYNVAMFGLPGAKPESGGQKLRPVFIVGMPRSGTSLVEKILAQHKEVDAGGELEAMQFVATEYAKQIGLGQLPAPGEMTTQQWQALRNAYLDKIPQDRKVVLTDKLPHNFQNVGLIVKLFPEAKIIQMHRDVQDVCLSVYSMPFSRDHSYACDLSACKHFYAQAERLMGHWSSMHSPQILDLQYENLVRQPEYYAQQVFEFCDLKWRPEYLDFHQNVSQSYTFSELAVREPISEKRIGRWQAYREFLPELGD